MTIDKDTYGWFRQHMQCSYLEDLPVTAVEHIAIRIGKRTAARDRVAA